MGRQTPPFAPQSAMSLEPSLVSAFVIVRPNRDLSSPGNIIDFAHLDDQDGLFRTSHFMEKSMGV
jgi:hypothetical protein